MSDHPEHGPECLCDHLSHEPVTHEREEAVDEARHGLRLSRRSIMAGIGAAGMATTTPQLAHAGSGPEKPRGRGPHRGAELVLLGTRAGPPVDTDSGSSVKRSARR